VRIVKRSTFQLASTKIELVKIMQNQHEYIIDRVLAIVKIHHFLNPKLYGHLHHHQHDIQILFPTRFLEKLVRKKLNQTVPWTRQLEIKLFFKSIFKDKDNCLHIESTKLYLEIW
jgi:hypothetical protein